MKTKNRLNKHAISGVVTAVLLILIAISAVVLVWVVIKNQLDKAQLSPDQLCLNPEIKIQSACYNQTSAKTEVKLSRIPQQEINELDFALTFGDQTDLYCCGKDCLDCDILDSGTKTYFIESQADSVTIKYLSCLEEKEVSDC